MIGVLINEVSLLGSSSDLTLRENVTESARSSDHAFSRVQCSSTRDSNNRVYDDPQ